MSVKAFSIGDRVQVTTDHMQLRLPRYNGQFGTVVSLVERRPHVASFVFFDNADLNDSPDGMEVANVILEPVGEFMIEEEPSLDG